MYIHSYKQKLMTTKVNKWGNGLGVRINKQLANEMGLEAGSEVEIVREDGRLVIKPKKEKFKMTIEWLCDTYLMKEILFGYHLIQL